jgi:radical SAM superfamily enzyme YgiQ (UPF0313 family)
MQQVHRIKKVLLINPPTGIYDRENRCQSPVKKETINLVRTPMDLAYMAAVLEQEQIECKIQDYPALGITTWDAFRDDLKQFAPDMVVISVTTPTLKDDLVAAAVAKSYNKNILVVAKGAYLVKFSVAVLEEYPDLDVAIRGECEFIVKDIVASGDLSLVKGITYRSGSGIIENEPAAEFGDIDGLPFPARHLLNNNLYRAPDTGKPITLVLTNRGCPNNCIYCLSPVVSGRTVRQRKPEHIVLELEECVNKYGIRDFFFRADTFTWNKQWLLELCKGIIEKKLSIRWGTNSRVNTLDEERIIWMKKAGCDIIGLGIESGDQNILNGMKKGITLDQCVSAVSLCREHGIKTYLFFVLGMPDDSEDTIRNTIKFAASLNGDFYNFFIAYPFPGTELYEICVREKLFEHSSLFRHDFFMPVIRTRYLNNNQIRAFERQAQIKMLLRPQALLRIMRSARSPRIALNYIRGGIGALKNALFQSQEKGFVDEDIVD